MAASKAEQRRLLYDLRNAQVNKSTFSQCITETLRQNKLYQEADTVMWYLHCRSEVQTLACVAEELAKQEKKIIIPYCTKDSAGNNALGLWHLEDFEELEAGMWEILEPPAHRFKESTKHVPASELDLVVVPGVAFDAQGGRLGNGAGYYDRLLAMVTPDTHLIALAYESQMIAQVCMQEYDIYMDWIITEQAMYQGKGRVKEL